MPDDQSPSVTSRDGFLAFLDILGWSKTVEDRDFGDLFPRYSRLIDDCVFVETESRATAEWGHRLPYIVFSDSIVVHTMGKDEWNLGAVITVCSRLFCGLLNLDLPVRGCISCGTFWRHDTEKEAGQGPAQDYRRGVVIAGRPLVEAHCYEQKQDWIGLMLSPRLVQEQPAIRDLHRQKHKEPYAVFERAQGSMWPFFYAACDSIPFHGVGNGSEKYEGYAVLPSKPGDTTPQQVATSIRETRDRLLSMSRWAPEPRAQRKYRAPLDWLENQADVCQRLHLKFEKG